MEKAIALLKSGETIELPFEQMVEFVVRNSDLIAEQQLNAPLPPRRQKQKTVKSEGASNK